MLKRLMSLVGLIVAAWLTILFGLFAIFRLVFEFTMPSQSGFAPVLIAVLRAFIGVGVGVAWLLIWQKLASIYLWRSLKASAKAH